MGRAQNFKGELRKGEKKSRKEVKKNRIGVNTMGAKESEGEEIRETRRD